MSNAHSHQLRRQEASSFDPRMYYTLNNLVLPLFTLSAGYADPSSESASDFSLRKINVTAYGTYSSENWQLFPQSGRYFIRNYDAGSVYQLGIEGRDSTGPQLLPRSGSISQQWTLTEVNGGWEMRNELLGSGSVLAMPRGWSIPVMNSGTDGAVWNITSNVDATKITPIVGDMLSSVQGFQIVTPTPTPTPSSASASASASASTTSTTTDFRPAISGYSTPAPQTSHNSALSAGAIAGIVIGALALLGIAIFALWFFLFKRKRQPHQYNPPYEVSGQSAVTERYAYNTAELAMPPAEIASKEHETVHNRAELSSSFESTADSRPVTGERMMR